MSKENEEGKEQTKLHVPLYPLSVVSERTGYDSRQILYRIRTGKVKGTKMGWLWYLTDEEIEILIKLRAKEDEA